MTTTKSEAIPVHIVFVLDRSGSMGPLQNDVVNGFNKFLADQQAQPGKCRMTLVQFDSQDPLEVLCDATPIKDVKPLTTATYVPRGGTPLLDAEGRSILRIQARENERRLRNKKAESVLFVTYTDGEENASREWTFQKLTEAKKAAEERGWTFMYLGCGHDAYGQSSLAGTSVANTQVFAQTAAGTSTVYNNLSQVTSGVRTMAYAGDSSGLLRASKNAYDATGVNKDAEEEMAKDKS